MAKKKDTQTKTVAELDKEISETRAVINKGRMEMKMRKVKDTNTVKKTRRYLAQLLTARNFKVLTDSNK